MIFFKADEYALFYWTTALKEQKTLFLNIQVSDFVGIQLLFWAHLGTSLHLGFVAALVCPGILPAVEAVKLMGAGLVARHT